MKRDMRDKLIELSKLICGTCGADSQVCYDSCRIHKLINEIMDGANNG